MKVSSIELSYLDPDFPSRNGRPTQCKIKVRCPRSLALSSKLSLSFGGRSREETARRRFSYFPHRLPSFPLFVTPQMVPASALPHTHYTHTHTHTHRERERERDTLTLLHTRTRDVPTTLARSTIRSRRRRRQQLCTPSARRRWARMSGEGKGQS